MATLLKEVPAQDIEEGAFVRADSGIRQVRAVDGSGDECWLTFERRPYHLGDEEVQTYRLGEPVEVVEP